MNKIDRTHPYIPNSAPILKEKMLKEIGVSSIEEFYACIPESLRKMKTFNLPDPLSSEYELKRHVENLVQENISCQDYLSFLGGGCWQHHVPAVCDEINNRSEFLTAYDGEPYEDHGKFQALFEYASMMAELVGMDVVNVPTYDGAQAAATSLCMATRITDRNKIVVGANSHPDNKLVIENYCYPSVSVETVGYTNSNGMINLEELENIVDHKTAAVYIENPSFFGSIESQVEKIAELVHQAGGLLVVNSDPSSLGVLKPPSHYGADIVCGDIQPLGLHMYYGGARAGFIATPDEKRFIKEYPSRLFGIAPTTHGEWGFGDVAWERTSFASRENAKEFVGTAAALWAITAGVYLALMGPSGMEELGRGIIQRNIYLRKKLMEIPRVRMVFPEGYFFKDLVINLDESKFTVQELNKALRQEKIFGCIDLSESHKELGQSGLLSVTEIHSASDIDRLGLAMEKVLN